MGLCGSDLILLWGLEDAPETDESLVQAGRFLACHRTLQSRGGGRYTPGGGAQCESHPVFGPVGFNMYPVSQSLHLVITP